jgi:hypothetical protein
MFVQRFRESECKAFIFSKKVFNNYYYEFATIKAASICARLWVNESNNNLT